MKKHERKKQHLTSNISRNSKHRKHFLNRFQFLLSLDKVIQLLATATEGGMNFGKMLIYKVYAPDLTSTLKQLMKHKPAL